MPHRPGSPRCAVALALAATTCRPPCDDMPAPPPTPAPQPAPGSEPEPGRGPPPTACALSPDDVRASAVAYLAALAGSPELPPSLTTSGNCTSHCVERERSRFVPAERCDSWECTFRYAQARPWNGDAGQFAVHVIGCGARVFSGLDLAACFARPHRCALAVDRTGATALAGRYFDEFELQLDWTRDQEFRWRVVHGAVELATISVHVPEDIRPGAGAPTVPLRPKTPENPPRAGRPRK